MLYQLLQISKTQPLKSYHSTKEWAKDYFQLIKDKAPFEKAVLGGFSCQQFSFAFLAGYQAALDKMFPTIAPNELKALCVSEVKGGHPKAMQTTLINHQIKGLKTYVTAGSDMPNLLVLCKTKEVVDGRPLLKLVYLPSSADNIEFTNFELSFMKEVKHGKVTLNNTQIKANQILEGDGYTQYAKPFRTFEDVCVGAAYQAMLLRQAIEHNWDAAIRDQLFLSIYTLKNILDLPPSHKTTHLLLATQEGNFKNLLPQIEVNIKEHSPTPFYEDWTTNKKLITLGEKMKEIRLLKARATIFS